MVHRRQIAGKPVLFGNQGALWGNAMTWWDHETGSIWSQPLGEAIAGPFRGHRLDPLPSTLTSWSTWREAHPETMALDAATDQSGFSLDSMVIVLDLGDDPAAYPVPAAREMGVVNDVVAGLEVAIVFDPAAEDRWTVFSRRLADQVVALSLRGDLLTDIETGSVWNMMSGRAVSGPLSGRILTPLPAFTVFPDDFQVFWPEGRFWEP